MLKTAHLINRLPSRVLGFKSPMQVFSQFFPNFNTLNNLTPRMFGCVSSVHIHGHNRGRLDLRALNCIFIGYFPTQKGYRCYHPPSWKFFVFADVTLVEREDYFTHPYLQGKTSLTKDKDKDSFLLDFPSISQSSSSEPAVSLNHPLVLPIVKPSSSSLMSFTKESVTHNPIGPLQVYSRRKESIVEPVQIQELKPISGNEFSALPKSSFDNLCATIDNNDLDQPIALKKGT